MQATRKLRAWLAIRLLTEGRRKPAKVLVGVKQA